MLHILTSFPLSQHHQKQPCHSNPQVDVSTGHFSLRSKSKMHQKWDLTLISANESCGWAHPPLPHRNEGNCSRCVCAPKRGSSRQRCLTGPATAVCRRQGQLQRFLRTSNDFHPTPLCLYVNTLLSRMLNAGAHVYHSVRLMVIFIT